MVTVSQNEIVKKPASTEAWVSLDHMSNCEKLQGLWGPVWVTVKLDDPRIMHEDSDAYKTTTTSMTIEVAVVTNAVQQPASH